ncbi:MAG: Rqc2 family fibronectin-binding protein [Chloroflexia bacterium]
MFYDALTAHAVVAELRRTIRGGRVQHVVQSGPLTLGLEIYAGHRRHYLVASAHPENARLHLVQAKPSRDPRAQSPLLLHLRKRLVGAYLEEVTAWPLERVIEMTFRHPGLPPEEQVNHLIVEVMGRQSNILLVDADQCIVDAIKRVTPRMSPARPVLPRTPYRPPPPQLKLDPRTVTAPTLEGALSGVRTDLPLWQALVHLFRGVSPLLAREVCHRAGLGDDLPISEFRGTEELAAALRDAWQPTATGEWEPCLALALKEAGPGGPRPLAYAPYRLSHRSDWLVEPRESISEALEQYYAWEEPVADHAPSRRLLLEAIARQQEKLQNRLEALRREQAREAEAERLLQMGQLILAYQRQVNPGQETLRVEGLEIPLDPHRTLVENAQAYFHAYRKARQAGERTRALIQEAELEMDWLAQMGALVREAETFDELALLSGEIAEAGLLPQDQIGGRRKTALPPRAFLTEDGFRVLVGRNARQNEELTFRRARPHDLWLHARTRPGAHVLLLTEGRTPSPQAIEFAAGLAAYYSDGRNEAAVEVDVTECRYVRRLTSRHPGLVRYTHERTLRVRPQPPEPER